MRPFMLNHALEFCADIGHTTGDDHAASASRAYCGIEFANHLEVADAGQF
jgi:hypothetical protein